MKFSISTGNSRKDKIWKQKEVYWEEFTKKLSNTIVTSETQAEYRKMKKFEQDNIKDVGGFVAGELKDGRRKKENVISRSMLTLDMDYADDVDVIVSNIEMLFDFNCCIYSTHKHTHQKPRLRLIIPLNRKVEADEYQAISRMVAKQIGIEMFDDTTYEPNRLMYWPSTSSDGEYIFKVIDGVLLSPDNILSIYKDWRITTSWPVSSRQTTIIENIRKKQENPLEKRGMVGAFCKSYSITEAIESFLENVYERSLVEDRYDYIPANSSAGVVIYDNKYVYSHHATDPACGKLLNSFDLVRIHLYGDLDEEANINKKPPSYKAMVEFCTKDEKVKRQLALERENNIKEEFSEIKEVTPNKEISQNKQIELNKELASNENLASKKELTSNENWQIDLELNTNGSSKDTPTNILIIMRNDPRLKAIAYNQMKQLIDIKGKLPWKQVKQGWTDTDLANLKMYFDRHYGIWSPAKINDALLTAAAERAFHPIRDYFEALPAWDGTKRVDALLIDYLGAEDNDYSRAVMRKTLVAAVARIYQPGIKFDYILVLNGPQGIGKSTFFGKLGGKWFSDSLTVSDMRDKAGAEKLQGYWILELGELAGLRKMDVETVKSFITRRDDKFRQSYGINVENHPRQCVIVGSTNSTSGFLRDVTGNRRFWPVRVRGGIKKVWNMTDVDQIWAEALLKYKAGEPLMLTGKEEQKAHEEQRDAMESDDREGMVEKYLETKLPKNWDKMDIYQRRTYLAGESEFGQNISQGQIIRKKVCPIEIWCECFEKDRTNIKRIDSYEIEGIIMRIGGWSRYDGNKKGNMKFAIYDSQRAFIRNER